MNDGRLDSIADTIKVSVLNTHPVADAGADFDVSVTAQATLDGSASSDFNDSSLTYRWSIDSKPAGSTAALSSNSAVSPTFIVDMRGSYTLSLVVNDGMDDSSPDSVIVTGINTKPTADAGSDQTIVIGESTAFDGSSSFDSNLDSLTYLWKIDSTPAHSMVTLTNETSATPALTPDLPGDFVLSLTVNDGTIDSAPDTVTLSVSNTLPVADAGGDQSIEISKITNMDGSNSFDAEGQPLTYQWSFTSVPQNSTSAISNASTVFASFTPDQGGDYLVSLVVNDGYADSIADILTISVRDTRPTAVAGDDVQITTQYTVALDGSNSSDQNNLDLDYYWTLESAPTGSTATLSDENVVAPTFRPDTEGSYLISLIVNNGLQNSAIDTMLINVTDWITNTLNRSNFILDNGTGILVNVQSVTKTTVDNTNYLEIQTTGIGDYTVTMTQGAIDSLNSRPNAASDFSSGSTNVIVSQKIQFGESVGYANDSCSLGYWPTGTNCPTDQQKVLLLPINPKPSSQTCNTGRRIIGLTLNGTSLYSWANGASYNSEGLWRNVAPKFGVYDLGACSGHAVADGEYHHHRFSSCLQNEIGDDGQSHSPIYAFAADGFPIHGPYYAQDILAESAWVARDYADVNSTSGCGVAGERSCVLVDQYDVGKGTTATTAGPTTSATV
ncbi:MAG: PKD domain-containing protein, partial [Psychrosphaera sp.]|nr:PKD domain-containing protein [Psychrosphaera sp.]